VRNRRKLNVFLSLQIQMLEGKVKKRERQRKMTTPKTVWGKED